MAPAASKNGFDAGVRLAEAVPQDMIAMPLGPHTRHVVVGAPSYFANKPRPIAPADLMDHEFIRARHSSGALYRWEFERHGEAMRVDVPGSLTLDEPDMMAQAGRCRSCRCRRVDLQGEDWKPHPGVAVTLPKPQTSGAKSVGRFTFHYAATVRFEPARVQRTVNGLDVFATYAIGSIATYWLIERTSAFFV